MKGVHVTSEIGQLKRVLLHRPGKELLNLTPNHLEELLFDDIPYLENAIKEHDMFAETLRENGVEVIYLEDLVTEVMDSSDEIKKEFIKQFMDEAKINSFSSRELVFNYLMSILDNKEFVLKTMEGIRVSDIPEIKDSSFDKFITKPMPNLYFTRDNFACVGDGISLHHMYSETRNRECIYAEYIFKYHKDYQDIPKFYNRDYTRSIEGGDILVLNEHTVAIGISQRTEMGAIKKIAKNYFKHPNCNIDTVVVFHIPQNRACMHLDTVFTQVDSYTFTYYPGILDTLEVFLIQKELEEEEYDVHKVEGSLENILEKIFDHPITLIPCAGGDVIASQREQWTDGSNTLCIRPGVVIVYDRNNITNDVLRNEGITVIEIPSSELSRGRGGPRCMSMPLIREDI